MAYAQGDLILDDHYNTFATGNADGTTNHAVANINTVWGVGNGNKGYGQTSTLSAVSAGSTVTATQWSTMISRLNSILTHQSGAGSGLGLPTAGSTITYLSTLSTNVTNAFNNRLNFNTRGTASTTNYDGTWNVAAPTTFSQTRTVTFASSDQARYFFNAGGRVALVLSSPSGGADTAKEQSITALANSVGTLYLDQSTSGRTGSGQTLTTDGSSIGFWDLTTSNQTLITLTCTNANYTTNTVTIAARCTGTAGSNGGIGDVITFDITYNDAANDGAWNDAINMVLRAAVEITPPETTNLTDVWGTVTPAATAN